MDREDIATSDKQLPRDNTARDTLGKFFFDLGKVTFTAMVVGGIVTVLTDLANIRYWSMIVLVL